MRVDAELGGMAAEVLEAARARGWKIAGAESCTGGLIAALLTSIAGSSDVFERAFVTYSNEAKSESIGVPAELILAHGAVSDPVARAMAEGSVRHSHADFAYSVTGIAGPGGGSPQKPVGLVYVGFCRRGMQPSARRHVFDDRGRDHIRNETARTVLGMLLRETRES